VQKKQTTASGANDAPASNGPNWLLILLGIAALLVVLQALGIFKTFDSKKSSSWVDVKSREYDNRPMPARRAEKPTPQVEATLAEIARELEGPVFSNLATANTQKSWGLSPDEAQFYDQMRQKYAPQAGSSSAVDWLSLIKKAHGTYRFLEDVTGGNLPKTDDFQQSAHFYSQMRETFGVSEAESHGFAKSGAARTLGDWARFVEDKRKN
jgi:hypothetical protein